MPFDRNDDEAGLTAGPAVPAALTEPSTQPPAVRLAPRTSGSPQVSRRRSGSRKAPLPLAAAVTTSWAALVSFIPTMIIVGFAYAVDSTGNPFAEVLRLGLAGWLLSHGVPIRTGLGPIGLAPLVITAFAAWRVARAGVHTARAIGARRARSVWPTIAAGAGVGVVYSVIGTATAAAAQLPGMRVPVGRAAVTLGLFGLAAGLVGAASESGALRRATRALPAVVRDGLRAGAVATALVFASGAAAAGMSIALAGGEASQMLADYDTGVIGQAGLTLICLLYSPTLAVWATSYLIGPGFIVGTGTTITAARVTLGPLPAVPALAGLPADAAPGWGSILLGLPLAAGMTAGWLLVRRARRAEIERKRAQPSWTVQLTSAALAGPAAGVVLGLASFAASGSLGAGRLASIGPRALPVAMVGAGIITVGAVLAVLATRLIITRRDPQRA